MNITEIYPLGKEVEYFGSTLIVPEWTKSIFTDSDGSVWCISMDKRCVYFNGSVWIPDYEAQEFLVGCAELGTFKAEDSLVEYD